MVDREKIASVILDGMKAQMTAMPGPAGHAFSADAGTLDLGKIADAVIATLASNPVDRAEAERLLDELLIAHDEYQNVPDSDLHSPQVRYDATRAAVLAAMTRQTPEGWRDIPVGFTTDDVRRLAHEFREYMRTHGPIEHPGALSALAPFRALLEGGDRG